MCPPDGTCTHGLQCPSPPGLCPLTARPVPTCLESAAWAVSVLLDGSMFSPSGLRCYHTQCLFFFIKTCKLCASKCWKLRIFHLFVERQTGWHTFSQTMKCSLAAWREEGKNGTLCPSSQEPESWVAGSTLSSLGGVRVHVFPQDG